jgi:hypothetical protein
MPVIGVATGYPLDWTKEISVPSRVIDFNPNYLSEKCK